MNRKTIFRLGLGVLTLGAMSAGVLVACSGDDLPTNPPGDASVDSPTTDAPSGDVQTDAPPAAPTKVGLAHSVANLGPVIACFSALGSFSADPAPALPPGVASQPRPNATIDLSLVAIDPYMVVLSARTGARLAAAGGLGVASCAQLFAKSSDAGADASALPELVEGEDYIKFQQLPSGSFVKGGTFMVLATGCAGPGAALTQFGFAGTPAECGSSFDGGSNLRGTSNLRILSLDKSAKANNGLQAIHASTEGQALVPTFLLSNPAPDAGADAGDGAVAAPTQFAANVPFEAVRETIATNVTGLTPGSTVIVRAATLPDGGGVVNLPVPVNTAMAVGQLASISPQKNYTFLITGNPISALGGVTYSPFADASVAQQHAAHLVLIANDIQ